MKTSRIFLLMTAILITTACSTIKSVPLNQTYEKEFIGKTSAYVQYVCGAPTKIEKNVSGGQVFMYDNIEDFVQHTKIDAGTTGEVAFVQMFFDKDDICYSVRTNHVQKVKELDKHLTWATVASSVGGATVLTELMAVIFSILLRK